MSLAFYKTDKDAELNGKWFGLMSGKGRVKLARIGNKEYTKVRDQLMKPYKKIIQAGGSVPEAKQDEILNETFARTIIKDWEDIEHPETGEKMEPTYENFMFALKYSDDFKNEIAAYASEMEAYRAETQKADAKNS